MDYVNGHPSVLERMAIFGIPKNSIYESYPDNESAVMHSLEAIFFIENPQNYS